MSDDNKSSDPFDIDFDSLNADEPRASTGESSFDLDNPFGDDVIVAGNGGMSTGDLPESTGGSSFDLANPFGDDLAASGSGVSADNPYLGGSAEDSEAEAAETDAADGDEELDTKKKRGGWFSKGKAKPAKGKKEKLANDESAESDDLSSDVADGDEESDTKKKRGGWFSKGKAKPAKGKKAQPTDDESVESDDLSSDVADGDEESDTKKKQGGWLSKGKTKQAKAKKEKTKKEKVVKEKKPKDESVPLDLGTVLCLALAVLLLTSLVLFNIAVFLSRGPDSSMMQTLCFLGAFNIVALVPTSVVVLFFKLPKEQRTLPNIMLGISIAAMFSALLVAVSEFYRYSFMLGT